MQYYLIIPAHNEARFISAMIESVLNQTLAAKKIVVVNDHSTDQTEQIVRDLAQKDSRIVLLNNLSDAVHQPGSKVIRAFEKGLSAVDDAYDFIVKLDADLILPQNYFETVAKHFAQNPKVGMVGGFAYIEKNGNWVLENLTDKDHIRGAFKAYRKECFEQMGGLRPAMGWDTADELLARYYGWEILTDESLKVKHLKPTGANYNRDAGLKQGAAFYTLGYGFMITLIASIKLALRKKKPMLLLDYIIGFYQARSKRKPMLVTPQQSKFIRNYRWMKMKQKLTGKSVA
jgi:glycosyltransferase involved in cell wall biosynthesis